jgi:glycerate dehydrogenase
VRGVILDLASLGGDGLDLQPMLAALEQWGLHSATSPEQVAARIADADVVLSNKVVLDAAALAAAPQLRLVLVMASGTNNVDLQAAAALGIAVCNVRDYATASVAQHTMLLILALARSLPACQASVHRGDWGRSPFFCLLDHPLVELEDRCLGIVGYGASGREVARLAQAFGMRVVLAAVPGRDYAETPGLPRMELGQMLATADVISIHCPLTPQTRGLIGAAQLQLMRPDALLVNTARGGIVDEQALLAALRSGQLAGAAIDTLENEPPSADDALLNAGLPNLIITPHVAWASRESRQRLVDRMGQILRAFRQGEFLSRVV